MSDGTFPWSGISVRRRAVKLTGSVAFRTPRSLGRVDFSNHVDYERDQGAPGSVFGYRVGRVRLGLSSRKRRTWRSPLCVYSDGASWRRSCLIGAERKAG